MKLILCAGTRLIEGFKSHDVKSLEGIDYVCDLHDIERFIQAGSCEDIHFTHALEHFSRKETPVILDIVYRLLMPNGKLYLEVPNFKWHSELIAQGKDRDAVYYAFGGQEDEWDFHKTGFTPKILQEELEDAGFREIRIQDASSISAWAIK